MDKVSIIGIDLAKRVFQAHGSAPDGAVMFRKKLYAELETLQSDLDAWIFGYNTEPTHQGKMCCGRTPMATREDGKQIWEEKFVA